MADTPHVGIINAEKVVVAHEIHGGIHAERVTVLTFPSGQRFKRAFANVPRQGPELIGRDKLFAEMRERVVEGGRLALYGLPGAGKTALAHTLAYDEAVLKRFSGGVLRQAGNAACADAMACSTVVLSASSKRFSAWPVAGL